MLFAYLVTLAFGGLVGIGELVSRYRDEPGKAIATKPGLFYIAINALASAAALLIINAFDWQFGVDGDSDDLRVRVIRVMVAGFGSMALFRSSLFAVRVGDQDVQVGPGGFLQVVLGAIDRAVDRHRAGSRSRAVKRIMEGIAFEKAHVALPAYCLALMQNLPADDQKNLAEEILDLKQSSIGAAVKALSLGLSIMNYVGENVLAAGVEALGETIETGNAPAKRKPAARKPPKQPE